MHMLGIHPAGTVPWKGEYARNGGSLTHELEVLQSPWFRDQTAPLPQSMESVWRQPSPSDSQALAVDYGRPQQADAN
jgi:hypothetical protein